MMQRVMIIGQPGSGKSTLARSMGALLAVPVVHIDHIYWQAGWLERTREQKTLLCQAVEAPETWIFEGGHSATWANRMARADLVVWLDMPFGLRFWRVLRRSVVWFGQNRPDLPEGCVEGFNHETLPFWAFIWRRRQTARQRILRMVTQAPEGKKVAHLRTRAKVQRFLANLSDK